MTLRIKTWSQSQVMYELSILRQPQLTLKIDINLNINSELKTWHQRAYQYFLGKFFPHQNEHGYNYHHKCITHPCLERDTKGAPPASLMVFVSPFASVMKYLPPYPIFMRAISPKMEIIPEGYRKTRQRPRNIILTEWDTLVQWWLKHMGSLFDYFNFTRYFI